MGRLEAIGTRAYADPTLKDDGMMEMGNDGPTVKMDIFICPNCGEGFITRAELTKHLIGEHGYFSKN